MLAHKYLDIDLYRVCIVYDNGLQVQICEIFGRFARVVRTKSIEESDEAVGRVA